MYQCVLFDMDGTLVNSYKGIYHAYEWTLKKMNWEFGREAFVRKAIGAPLPLVFQELCGMSESQTRQAVLYYRRYYDEQGKQEVELYEGMEDTLKQIRAAGCFLGVATLKKEQFAREILERLQVLSYFDVVCGADEADERTKADLILECLRRSGSSKEECILVGDSEFDAKGAAEAGVDFMAVLYGFGFQNMNALRSAEIRGLARNAGEIGQWICGKGEKSNE